jgi:hypothetical protein
MKWLLVFALVIVAIVLIRLLKPFRFLRSTFTFQDALVRIRSSPLQFPADQGPGLEGLPGHVRLANERISIVYWKTSRPDGIVVETIDMVTDDEGLRATFQCEALCVLHLNAIRVPPELIAEIQHQAAREVLGAIRSRLEAAWN